MTDLIAFVVFVRFDQFCSDYENVCLIIFFKHMLNFVLYVDVNMYLLYRTGTYKVYYFIGLSAFGLQNLAALTGGPAFATPSTSGKITFKIIMLLYKPFLSVVGHTLGRFRVLVNYYSALFGLFL